VNLLVVLLAMLKVQVAVSQFVLMIVNCVQLLVLGKICSDCPSHCKTCMSGTSCTETGCDTDYSRTSSGSCTPDCTANCQTCAIPATCDKCNAGYFESSNTCLNCPSNCDTCTSGTACNPTGCKTGYAYSSSSCTPICASNCNACTTPGTCTTCRNGYILTDAKKCEYSGSESGSGGETGTTCPSRCVSCTSSACEQCADGYALFNNNKECNACPSGSYAQDSICKPCPTGCPKCVSDSDCKEGGSNVAAIVGGIVGGAVVLTVIIVVAIKKKAILGLKNAFTSRSSTYQLTYNHNSRSQSPNYSHA